MTADRYISTQYRAPARRRAPRSKVVDIEAHRETLVPLLRAIDALCRDPQTPPGALDHRSIHRLLRTHPREQRGLFSRSELIAGAEHLADETQLSTSIGELRARLRMRPVRSQSGVMPVTVLTMPYPCPGECIFCPNDVRMPKSYLSDEPGSQRAEDNDFDPYRQTKARLASLRAIGHPTDKIEFIVLGGTFSHYPEGYQRHFVERLFAALNDGDAAGRVDSATDDDGRIAAPAAEQGVQASMDAAAALARLPRHVDGRDVGGLYNRLTRDWVRERGGLRAASWEEVAQAQRRNESATSRAVGLVVETRPDRITPDEIVRLRRLGVTKVQLGVQSLSDGILAANGRGHDVAAIRRAFRLLRRAGFKILAHFMPNLLGATPEGDRQGFARLFADPDFRPDELKVYPCSLIESAALVIDHEQGRWQPYDDDTLLGLIEHALATTPRYCRLSRVIRDISSDDIMVGNRRTNLRQVAAERLERAGVTMRDVRAREIGSGRFDPGDVDFAVTRYRTGVGEEVFLEATTSRDRLLGLLRLSLPDQGVAAALDPLPAGLGELEGAALVRELHVYGEAKSIADAGLEPRPGDSTAPRSARPPFPPSSQGPQHRGIGKRLVAIAAEFARAAGLEDLAVISAVGTRPYYRSLGFRDGVLYQHLALT